LEGRERQGGKNRQQTTVTAEKFGKRTELSNPGECPWGKWLAVVKYTRGEEIGSKGGMDLMQKAQWGGFLL